MRRREQRIRRKARAALRALERNINQAAALNPIALAAIRYVSAIEAPDLKEPFCISNRRTELRELVLGYLGRHSARRVA